MSTSTTSPSRGSSISQHLSAAKKILRDTFNMKIEAALDGAEIDVLEQDAFEVLRLVRALKNSLAPINRIPLEVLSLIPDFWDTQSKNKDAIPISHVCRAWREVFISHVSLWTNFDCIDMDKTRVYLERSKFFPIDLWIGRENDLSLHDPLLQVIPHATSRLKSLTVHTTPERIGPITTRLSHPAPHIEHLSIYCSSGFEITSNPILETVLLGGNLSSLHSLHLMRVRTELSWRNMINLTSLTLGYTLPGDVSIGQLLAFLGSAPRLESVRLENATPTTGPQDGRLVSLERLKLMSIQGDEPCSFLLNHLLIPVGTKLSILANSFSRGFESHLPRSLDNLRNLSDLTNINLNFDGPCPDVRLTGPNGQITLTCASPQVNPTSLAFECLGRIDTSKTEWLEIRRGNPPFSCPPYQVLLHMKNLRTLKLSRCQSPHLFIRALRSGASSSGAAICPKLEELVLVPRTSSETFNIRDLITMAAARALGGVKLRTVRIIGGQGGLDPGSALELGKYVLHVEYPSGNGAVNSDSDDSYGSGRDAGGDGRGSDANLWE